VPPLRDRVDDLRLLTAHFLGLATPPRSIEEVPPPVWEMFCAHRWPGNVRELGNAVQRLLVTPERALQSLGASPSRPPPAAEEATATLPLRIARREASDTFERAYLEALLERTGGNVTRAAAIAEVSRQMVQKLMRKHGIG
jgi:DNA-binding NtrC family response regulator